MHMNCSSLPVQVRRVQPTTSVVSAANPAAGQLPDSVHPEWPITQPQPANAAPGNQTAPTFTMPSGPQAPQLFPEDPMFLVPANPLLPEGYQEYLNYSQLQYLNGFLRTQIGNYCEVTVMIGTDNTAERSGVLLAVGINYILLMDPQSNEILTIDFYNIKFVRFYTR